MNYTDPPNGKRLHLARVYGILIENDTGSKIEYELPGQVLTLPARELFKIANPPPTSLDFLRNIAEQIRASLRLKYQVDVDAGRIVVQLANITAVGRGTYRYEIVP